MAEGTSVLILGGLGMIGRSLVKYILDYELAGFVRVVDKQVAAMAYLNEVFRNAFADPRVEVVQGDLSVESHVEKAFDRPFNIVVALASETQYGHLEIKYERNILMLRTLCAKQAATLGTVEKYIEVSTAQVYEAKNDRPAAVGGKTNPWTTMAKFHLAAEHNVKKNSDLPVIVLRLPIVYGPADLRGLMPRIVCAAVYEHTGDRMEFLWGEELRIHTVHVQDVAAGIWHLCCAGESGETYNLVDENDTTQGKLNAVLESIFHIKTGFYGSIMSNLAQLKLDELVDEANDGHMGPWEELLQAKKITHTPTVSSVPNIF